MWPDDAFSLPARDGYDVGGAQERAMSARVDGYGGIRETYEVNPDGSVTTLRTRLGWPTFETTGARVAADQSVPARGFVAKVPGGRAVLFNPYTLAILQSPYLPASNSYSVQDFWTTWNVAPADTTHWYDVVLFDGTTIKVNSKAMPSIRITADHSFPAIPYVINRGTSDDQYGNAERNTTEKRVFAVGRFSVKSWGGSGVVETLTPTTPRSDNKAMTIGPWVDSADDTAWIGQLYYTGSTWDAFSGAWQFSSASVKMLLTSAYLVKTSQSYTCEIPVSDISFFGGTTPGTSSETFTLPAAEAGPIGVGEARGTSYPDYDGVAWPYREVLSYAFIGQNDYSFSDTTAAFGYAGNVDGGDFQLHTEIANTKTFSARSKSVRVPSQYVPLPASGSSLGMSESQYFDVSAGTHYWYGHVQTPIPYIGPVHAYINGDNVPLIGSGFDLTNANYSYDVQQCDITVKILETSETLVSVSFHTEDYIGEDFTVSPTAGNMAGFLANPYQNVTYFTTLGIYNYPGTLAADPTQGWSNITGLSSSWEGTRDYNSIEAFLSDCNSSPVIFLYYGQKQYGVSRKSASLNWSSVDRILSDTVNGVYVYVEATFVGAGVSATLDVILRVKTRYADVTQTLHHFSWTYGDLLPYRQIGSTGKYAVPTPQIRAIFTPLYQEQGSFKGAHYVTLDEEANGATPFHGFNFLLYLRSYGEFSTCNSDNDGQAVYFVPCNLLELLYCYVFSQDYGVYIVGDRYRVTNSARYNDVINNLFSSPFRVAVRNGTAGAWTDALGSDFASVSTVSLHRA